jgi:putative inorganic carbon (hco3(-)) transporter
VSAVVPSGELQVGRGPGVTSKALTVLAVLVAAAVAAFSGLGVGSGSKLAVILPLALAAGVMLAVLAFTRFSLYVMALLVLRASIDLAKLSDGQTATATGGAEAAGRGLDPSSLFAVVFLLASAVWLAAQHYRQGALPGSALRRALLVFVAAAAISLPSATNLRSGGLELLRILAAVMMFIVLEQLIVNHAVLRRVLLAAFLSLVFPLAYTLSGFVAGGPASEVKGAFTRITGPFSTSNVFARYLMLMIIFGVAIYPHVGRRLRLALGAALALSSVFLLLTYTRTAIIGTAIGVVLVGALHSRRLLLGLLVLAVCAFLLVPQLSSRFTQLGETVATPADAASRNTLTWRINYWTEVLPLANSSPVTGIGLTSTQFSTDKAKQPHNDFVRAYVETGLIGFGAYLAVLVALVALGLRAVRASPPGTLDRGVAVGFLGCAVAFVAVSLAANVLSNVVLLWYLFAFAAAASFVARQEPPPLDTSPSEPEGSLRGN